MKQKPNTKLRDLLKSKKAKTRKLSELSKTEQNRLAKLNLMLNELRCGKNVQNRQLQTWLSEDEYAQVDIEWQEQLELREELKDKPDDLKRSEEKLKQATFNDNKAERFRKRGNKDKSTKFHNLSESHCEDALEILQAIIC